MAVSVNLSRRGFLTGSFATKAAPYVAVIGEGCLAAEGVFCASCGDTCPAAAIRFVPRSGGPFLPEIIAKNCTGCGACVAICPASAIRLKNMPGIASG
jgi:ferredoxin-type protein NapF